MKPNNKVFIILSSIFLGTALLMLLFEIYLNSQCLLLIRDSSRGSQNFGEALGKAIGMGFIYVILICTGIITAGISIPVIPFTAVMMSRDKGSVGYALTMMLFAIIFIIASIAIMFIVPAYSSTANASSSSLSSYYQ